MTVLTCNNCNGIGKLLSTKTYKSKKVIKIICPKCKNCWSATVFPDWDYKDALSKEKKSHLNKKADKKKLDEETAFGMLLKKAIEKSEKK